MRKPLNLHRSATAARSTVLVEITANDVQYEPGDHVGILPANRKEIVDGILNRLSGVDSYDEILQLQLLKENHTTNGSLKHTNTHFIALMTWTLVTGTSFCFRIFRCYEKLGTTWTITNLFIKNIIDTFLRYNDTPDTSAADSIGHILSGWCRRRAAQCFSKCKQHLQFQFQFQFIYLVWLTWVLKFQPKKIVCRNRPLMKIGVIGDYHICWKC